jgi:alpha-tubulin suppressor-like RCC1 family protein
LGGAPVDVASPLHHQHQNENILVHDQTSRTKIPNRAQKAFRSQPLIPPDSAFDDESSIAPIRSFDYSQFYDGGNAMHVEMESVPHKVSHCYHGVPSFLGSFANVKIKSVSAHPLGSHVLLISNAGLLYSYGLNNYGQLGIGIKSSVNSLYRGYVMPPTIVTPLVENGGKAIACAAGVSHSLVVVETEERRLVKARSFDQTRQRHQQAGQSRRYQRSHSDTESVSYHQLYGFGRNDYMKIGLASPKISKHNSDEMESVLLPHRVGLRCSVRSQESWDDHEPLPQGIFAIAASLDHSAALVRRASGDVELYTWGNAMYSALGLPQPTTGIVNNSKKSPHSSSIKKLPVRIVPVPSFVACLSKTSNPDAKIKSQLMHDEYPTNLSLGRHCSFVTTSAGRCFSFGESEEGMLGLGENVIEAEKPTEILMPPEARDDMIVSVSAGSSHVIARTRSGCVYGWGTRCQAGLPCASNSSKEQLAAKSKKKGHALPLEVVEVAWTPERISPFNSSPEKVVEACAGFDCSIFVLESGKVYSTGKNSGRLGQGELYEDVKLPKPLFGGLHLWMKRDEKAKTNAKFLKRGTTSLS